MSSSRSEHKKILLVIMLSIVMVIVAYFRFFHKKPGASDRHASRGPGLNLTLSNVEMPTRPRVKDTPAREAEPPGEAVRDIFSPPEKPKQKSRGAARQREAKATVPSLTLKGTILGGERPIAIINDRFLRTGDEIGAYTIVRIGKTEVLLHSGGRELLLEMVKK